MGFLGGRTQKDPVVFLETRWVFLGYVPGCLNPDLACLVFLA